MNEYLATPGSQWGEPNFTDVGLSDDLYRDSPLSELGKNQAMELYHKIDSSLGSSGGDVGCGNNTVSSSGDGIDSYCVDDIELVVLSPLTRAFQTLEYALLPHLKKQEGGKEGEGEQLQGQGQGLNEIDEDRTCNFNGKYKVPILSTPLASERVYLKSDLGLTLNELKIKFPYAQFDDLQDFEDEWWFTVKPSSSLASASSSSTTTSSTTRIHKFNTLTESGYTEWRPSSQNQSYSCFGEPDEQFNQRMIELYKLIESRDENCICIISHWGVLDWLTGLDFANCEWKEIRFEDVKKKNVNKVMSGVL